MLVISRRAGQSVLIGDDVEIHVVEVAGSRVKLAIQAPREHRILRKEVRVAENQNRAAAGGWESGKDVVADVVSGLRDKYSR